MTDDLWRLPGIGGELQDLYLESAKIKNPRFAWIAVVALFGVIGSRVYRTQDDNPTQIRIMVLAETGSGKNHIKTFIETCLQQSGLEHLAAVGEDGFASQQGMYSVFRNVCPTQIFVLDEGGDNRIADKGNPHATKVIAKMMAMAGDPNASLGMPVTSSRGLSPSERQNKIEDERPIRCVSLTTVEISTPGRLLDTVSEDEILSGRFGRDLIVSEGNFIPKISLNGWSKIQIPDHIRAYLRALRYNEDHARSEADARDVAYNELWQEHDKTDPIIRGLLTPNEAQIQTRLSELKEEPGFMSNNPDDPLRPPEFIIFVWEVEGMCNEIFVSRQHRNAGNKDELQCAMHNRKHEHAMRLSLIFALMDPATREGRVVTRQYATQADAVISQIVGETNNFVLPKIADGPTAKIIKGLTKFIQDANGNPVSVTDFGNAQFWRKNPEATNRKSALAAIESHNNIFVQPNKAARTRGDYNRNMYSWFDNLAEVERAYLEATQ